MADACCREEISKWWAQKGTGENASLLLDRFLRVAVKDKKNHPDARRDLFEAMCQSLVQSKETYTAAYERHEFSNKDVESKGLFGTAGRLIIGLGGENVLETGLTLHRTYGTPIIPGTALKGLAAHYCDQIWGPADDSDRFKLGGEYHRAIFGTTEDSGHIIFHDAWITPKSLEGSLQPDVMTPHHGEYYSDEKGLTPPTDFDDPIPVPFLSVVGTFHVAVSCDVPGEEGQKWAKLAFDLLTEALREWGIGGKTNAGYGRLVLADQDKKDVPSPTGEDSPIPPVPVARVQRYKRGDILEVTRIADPKEKRAKPYFMADDGIGGLVTSGTSPSVDIGQKTRVRVEGVMKEGYYVFAALTSEGKGQHLKKPGRSR